MVNQVTFKEEDLRAAIDTTDQGVVRMGELRKQVDGTSQQYEMSFRSQGGQAMADAIKGWANAFGNLTDRVDELNGLVKRVKTAFEQAQAATEKTGSSASTAVSDIPPV